VVQFERTTLKVLKKSDTVMSYYMDVELYSNFTSYYWPFVASVNNTGGAYEQIFNDVVVNISVEYHKWIFSIGACMLVGLSGIFPLLVFPFGDSKSDSYFKIHPGNKIFTFL